MDNDGMNQGPSNFTADNPAYSLPPAWVDTLDDIEGNIKTIKKHMNELRSLHQKAGKTTFDEKQENDAQRKIEVITLEITNLFRKTQMLLKRIASIGNKEGNLPYQERLVRLNVMRGKAKEIQNLSKEFRRHQKEFLSRMDNQSGQHMNSLLDEDDEMICFERKGFNDAQMQQIQQMQEQSSQRSEEIMKIVKSVEELSQMFNELQVLIVQQGTVLDRIDYNVEKTLVDLQKSKKELKSAETYQKRSNATLCIFGLLILIFLCAIVLIAKNVNGKKN